MKVKQILEEKSSKVWSVKATETLQVALNILVENKIGAVLAYDETFRIVGILSERDIMRVCHNNPTSWNDQLIKEVMTSRVLIVSPETELEYVMALMTRNRIRHLPVIEKNELIGIVSIGDVVKSRLRDTESELEHMKEYISIS